MLHYLLNFEKDQNNREKVIKIWKIFKFNDMIKTYFNMAKTENSQVKKRNLTVDF